VLLPDDIRGALAAEIDRLREAARGVAWVAPDNLHVTLKFLGEVASARLPAVADALAAVAATDAVFTLEIAALGAFPTPTRVRVVWAGLGEGRQPLASLAARVDDALSGLGFERESRPFAGHVTLGRVREPRRNEALAAALGRARRFGRFRVERLALMRSDLSPRGARYTPLETWPLAGLADRDD
jgi:2'-5' RNA ligase